MPNPSTGSSSPQSEPDEQHPIRRMCNEMGHNRTSRSALQYASGQASWGSLLMVGFAFGFGSRLLGKSYHRVGREQSGAPLRPLLEPRWDEETRQVIEKDQAAEDGHISRWKAARRGNKQAGLQRISEPPKYGWSYSPCGYREFTLAATVPIRGLDTVFGLGT